MQLIRQSDAHVFAPVEQNEIMTSDEYIQSLDDGRKIYIYGDRFTKVAEHPAFRGLAQALAAALR